MTRVDPSRCRRSGARLGLGRVPARRPGTGHAQAGNPPSRTAGTSANLAAATASDRRCFNCPSDGEFREQLSVPRYDTTLAGGRRWPAPTMSAAWAPCGKRASFAATNSTASSAAIAARGSNKIVDGTTQTFAVGERNHRLSTPAWSGVVAKSMVMDNTLRGKVAAGPAYVLGSTFLARRPGRAGRTEPRHRGRDFWRRSSRHDELSRTATAAFARSTSRSTTASTWPCRPRRTRSPAKASSTWPRLTKRLQTRT